MRCLLSILAVVMLAGCQTATTPMTNPFLSPSRVPAPATRSPAVGTAQPYYQSQPGANGSAFGTAPTGFVPGVPVVPGQPAPGVYPQNPQLMQPMSQPTYAPQPAGARLPGGSPPGGWGPSPQSTIQPIPQSNPFGAPTSYVQPFNGVQQVNAYVPVAGEPRAVRIRPVSSGNSTATGSAITGLNEGGNSNVVPSSDGFRPQGSRGVR